MLVKDRLQIVLITYNRAKYVEKTLNQFFAGNSPVKNYNFLVLDNNSTDNTKKIVENWQTKYSNIKYIKNKYNIGLAGNIAKAMELAEKDYVWIIGDDDVYDFSNWQEVEYAISNNEKMICVARYALPDKYKYDVAYQLLQITFITGGIYSTKLFNDTIIRNSFDNIYTLFPHIVPVITFINDGGEIYVVDKAIADNGMDIKTDCSYVRGAIENNMYQRSKTMSWIVGYCNVLSNLKNKKLKEKAIDIAIINPDIYGTVENFYNSMKYYHKKELFMNFIDVYINVSDEKQKRLQKDYLLNGNAELCDIGKENYYNINSEQEWIKYFKEGDEQNYINKLSELLKNKKVILYGAGMIAKVLFNNYDLSNIHITAIADKMFETNDISTMFGIKTMKPEDILNSNDDCILFAIKNYKKIEDTLKQQGYKHLMIPLLK